jgi:hypothetical protein
MDYGLSTMDLNKIAQRYKKKPAPVRKSKTCERNCTDTKKTKKPIMDRLWFDMLRWIGLYFKREIVF